MEIKSVSIPAKPDHEGILSSVIRLNWVCPKCGKPRGEVQDAVSFDGSRRLHCNGWQNPCGHVDKYSDVRKEALANGLNGG